jgi:hypothetical protein
VDQIPYLSEYEDVLKTLLKEGTWSDKSLKLSWELREGDFKELIKVEDVHPDMIFFDPYSPRVTKEMWTLELFQDLYRQVTKSDRPTILFTYSVSTPVRVALLSAGFFVGHGQGTGLKEETTIASTDLSLLKNPLGERWMIRWGRSQSRYPYDIKGDEPSMKVTEKIQSHLQFKEFENLLMQNR